MNARRKQTLTLALASVLVLGAAGGGLAYTKVTVDAADRTAATRVWKAPPRAPSVDDPVPDVSNGRVDTPLSKELLPVSADYRLGPDVEGFGNDAHLTGPEAEALFRKGSESLPSKQRKEHRRFVRKLRIEGMAMRSYTRYSDDLEVEITLAQLGDRGAVEDLNTFQRELADAFSILRKGPKIKGHDAAKCFLLPEDDDAELGEMFCTAHEDDVLVSLSAAGSDDYDGTEFDRKEVAKLLEKQLERLSKGGGISA